MSDTHSMTIIEFQRLLEHYHPKEMVVIEREDGYTFEREVHRTGPAPVASDTFVLYSKPGKLNHFALVDRTSDIKYMNGTREVIAITWRNPIGYAYLNRLPTDIFNVEDTWYIVASRNGESIPTVNECAERLWTRKNQFLQSQREAEKQRLEKVRKENVLREMADNSALHHRLIRDETRLQIFPELERYRICLCYAKDAQRFLATQTERDVKELEALVKELLNYEAINLQPMREEAEQLQAEAQEHEMRERERLEHEWLAQEKQQRIWQEESAQLQRDLAERRRVQQEQHYTPPTTYPELRAEVHGMKQSYVMNATLSVNGARTRARTLRQQCENASNEIAAENLPTTSSQSNDGAIMGAVIGGVLGLFAGPIGAVFGAAVGGVIGGGQDNNGGAASNLPPLASPEREKWVVLIREIDDFISGLPNQ